MSLDSSGNLKVDFVWGNFPLQPNDERANAENPLLGIGDSHKIAAVKWNSYPEVATSKNYMITDFEYIEGVTYECTSQNTLKAGDLVIITGIPYLNQLWQEYATTVTYADATKFQFEAEIGSFSKFTGLTGRVDVLDPTTGHALEDGPRLFTWPELWPCNGGVFSKVEDVIAEFVSYGVPANYFKDFTFSGGENEWDSVEGQPNWDGAILYSYIPANVSIGTNGSGAPLYGSDMDGKVIGGNHSFGYQQEVDSGHPEDYMLIVFSNDPRKNNAGWWGF